MSRKTFVWGGMFVGSSVGASLPMFWGGSMMGAQSILLSTVVGLLGIWIGFKLGSMFEV